jgi:glutamate N-acetyltransferase/amino-acid N-acetyltransferase
MIIEDGEGATKFISINVKGAETEAEARQAGMSIANSVLVKTAFFGQDANLGRILAALGHSGVDMSADEVDVYFASEKVAEAGTCLSFDEDKVNSALKQKEIQIAVVIGKGPGEANVWTTDLTHEYIDINASYRT